MQEKFRGVEKCATPFKYVALLSLVYFNPDGLGQENPDHRVAG